MAEAKQDHWFLIPGDDFAEELSKDKTLEKRLENEPGNDNYSAALRDLGDAWICTIHSFCRRVLAEYPVEAGLDLSSGRSPRAGQQAGWRPHRCTMPLLCR